MDLKEFTTQTVIKLNKFVEYYTKEMENDPEGYPKEFSYSTWIDEFRAYTEASDYDEKNG